MALIGIMAIIPPTYIIYPADLCRYCSHRTNSDVSHQLLRWRTCRPIIISTFCIIIYFYFMYCSQYFHCQSKELRRNIFNKVGREYKKGVWRHEEFVQYSLMKVTGLIEDNWLPLGHCRITIREISGYSG